MDAWAWITSQIGMFIVGAILLIIGYGYFKMGLSAKTLKLSRFAGIILVVLALLSYAGINLFAAEEAAPASTVGSFEVTATESLTRLTVDNEANSITWAVTYNYTAGDFSNGVGAGTDTQSQYAEVNFTVDRGLGTVGLVQTYADVTSVPSITNDTTAVSTPVLTKTGDQYNAIWTRADATSAYDMITLTIAETADGVTVTLNMTLAASAIGSMHQFDNVNIALLVGGEVWNVQVLLASVT
jgi:hypothetical protein